MRILKCKACFTRTAIALLLMAALIVSGCTEKKPVKQEQNSTATQTVLDYYDLLFNLKLSESYSLLSKRLQSIYDQEQYVARIKDHLHIGSIVSATGRTLGIKEEPINILLLALFGKMKLEILETEEAGRFAKVSVVLYRPDIDKIFETKSAALLAEYLQLARDNASELILKKAADDLWNSLPTRVENSAYKVHLILEDGRWRIDTDLQFI